MYKNILIATDGSKLSAEAIKSAVVFAKSINARITGCYVEEPYHAFYAGNTAEPEAHAHKEFEHYALPSGETCLAQIEIAAHAAGLEYSGAVAIADAPYAGIIETAVKEGCDLIFMASHGRRGLTGLLLGSETIKVLTHTKIPVLVYR